MLTVVVLPIPQPPKHTLQSLSIPQESSEPPAAKCSNALVPYMDEITLIIF